MRSTLFAALALLTLALPTGAAAETPEDPARFGPYAVGVTTLEVRSLLHPRETLHTMVWYPADVAVDAEPYVYLDDPLVGSLSFTAVLDAAIVREDGPYQVIAFSHGNGGVNYQSVFMTELLASHGYIVVSPDHPGNTLFDYNPTSLVTGWFTRPLDISAVLDEMERQNDASTSRFRDLLDMEGGVGMTGHSFGGYTTLAVAGARVNLNPPAERCARARDPEACAVLKAARATHRPLNDGFLDLSDPRVIAAVPLAPLGWEPFRAEGLAYLTVPLQLQGGLLDDTCPYETEVLPAYTYASGPKSLLEIFDAGHMAWTDLCELQPDYEECFAPFLPMDLAHDVINRYAHSHFQVYLSGDTRYETFLTDDAAIDLADILAWHQAL